MSRRTAVAAPAQPPFDDLLATIDAMDGQTLRAFIAALRERYALAEPPVEYSMQVRTSVTWRDGAMEPDWWRDRRWGTFS